MLRRVFLGRTVLRCGAIAVSLLLLPAIACQADRSNSGQPSDPPATPKPGTGLNGTLLVIGGGLDDDNRHVYERFRDLAAKGKGIAEARILIATAASGDQDAAAKSKIESLTTWCPGAKLDIIRRETTAEETVKLIDDASAIFFTGGDQKRITDRYRPNDQETPESKAIQRLLARGGVIAGTSAGDAMMGDVMFHTGRSAEALGIRSTRAQPAADDDPEAKPAEPLPLGPRIGPGMRMVPWVMTDSHFFERNRVGRLVAALEVSRQRLGVGVGEDACVEINLATGELIGTSVAESLLVDIATLERDGLSRRNVTARVIRQGTKVSLTERLTRKPRQPYPPAAPETPIQDVAVAEPGQNRQLASWRLFSQATTSGSGRWQLKLDGWMITAWPDGQGEVVFRIDAMDAAEAPRPVAEPPRPAAEPSR